MIVNIQQRSLECLLEKSPDAKMRCVNALWQDFEQDTLELRWPKNLQDMTEAGRPEYPRLVPPRELPRRRLGSSQGQAAMLHAIAHIEFNAINLALDAVCRYSGLPREFYADWLKVAAEEVYHFGLVRQRLRDLGHEYGDFVAHNGLWELARRTAHDPLIRMAMVPRVMEARGLDVTPDIMRKFAGIGDKESVDVLKIILRDEVGHVEAGSRWFHYLCEQRGLDSESTYFSLIDEYLTGHISCPLHKEARKAAGFSVSELEHLEAMCAN
ncbi:ferritin-like domain-containing protein [Thiolapillus sp.]